MRVTVDTDTLAAPLLFVWRSRVFWFLLGAALGTFGFILMWLNALERMIGT